MEYLIMGAIPKLTKTKNLNTSGYSLKKLARIMLMTPQRVWDIFVNTGVLRGYEDRILVTNNLSQLKEIATSPQFASVYRAYKLIEKFTTKASSYLLKETMQAFGPTILSYGPAAKRVTPNQVYTSPKQLGDTEMRAGLLAMQQELIEVLKTLVTNEQDVFKMIAYIQEGDFFGKVLQFTQEASNQEYIVFQRKFEECVCELTSEVMIALPGGLEQAPTLMTTYDVILKALYQLLAKFTHAYVELIQVQCD
jgi:hypothetical protein